MTPRAFLVEIAVGRRLRLWTQPLADVAATSGRLARARVCNEAASRLLSHIVEGEANLVPLLARSPEDVRFSRRADVELRSGVAAIPHAHSRVVRGGSVVTVLELQREQPSLDQRLLGLLTPRESEIAALVVDGLSDGEIAESLHLSRFTVHQHVKRIYCVLDVDSRVTLTPLLLGAPAAGRRPVRDPQD